MLQYSTVQYSTVQYSYTEIVRIIELSTGSSTVAVLVVMNAVHLFLQL